MVNEDVDSRTLLRRYEVELSRLRSELQTRQKQEQARRLEVLHMEARRAEADRLEALKQAHTPQRLTAFSSPRVPFNI
eukprot:SAG31_NODE_6410_length_2030_cov_1.110306_3_plen_78_part_00